MPPSQAAWRSPSACLTAFAQVAIVLVAIVLSSYSVSDGLQPKNGRGNPPAPFSQEFSQPPTFSYSKNRKQHCGLLGLLQGLRGGSSKTQGEEDEDLFGEDNNEAEKEALRQKAAQAHAKANAHKPPAKTNIVLDIKGWDDQTNFQELEKLVREIQMDGLVWGASGLEDVGFGIRKLRITLVVEDDKVSMDDVEERITALEDYVQSVDIVAMNKI